MTSPVNQGGNIYPNPDNYGATSFPEPLSPPDAEANDGDSLITVQYSWKWREVLLAAVDQLINPATWQGNHDEVLRAIDRAIDLKDLLAIDTGEVGTPFWDDETDVDDESPDDMQPWYGEVTNPDAAPGDLDFVESVLLWAFTGLVAVATFEVAGVAPAIAFHTAVEKFIILQKRGDVAETIRFVVDGQDAKFVNTAPYAPGEIISTPIVTPTTGGTHDLLIIGGSS